MKKRIYSLCLYASTYLPVTQPSAPLPHITSFCCFIRKWVKLSQSEDQVELYSGTTSGVGFTSQTSTLKLAKGPKEPVTMPSVSSGCPAYV